MMNEWTTGQEPARLTHENHPENRPEPAPTETAHAAQKKSTLFRTIVVRSLGGVIGMV